MPTTMKRKPAAEPSTNGHATTDLTKEYVAGGYGTSMRGFINRYYRTLPQYIDDTTRDLGADLYERMMNDAQVSSCVQLVKLAAIADGYTIRPAIDDRTDPNHQQASVIADYCIHCLENLPKPFNSFLYEMLDAIALGNKRAEKVYEADGGQLILKDIKAKPRWATSFVVDPFNNLVGLLPYEASGRSVDTANDVVPREKFCILTFNPTDNDPRGHSILRPAYNSWNFKIQLWPEYLKYLAQFAGPSLVGTLPENAQKRTESGTTITPQEDMGNALEQFKNGSYIVLAHGSELDALNMQGEGASFRNAFDLLDRQIAKAILLQTLATEEGLHQTRAASEVHRGLLDFVVIHARQALEAMIEFDVLYHLVLLNFGPDAARKFTPKAIIGEAKKDWHRDVEAVSKLMQAGYVDPGQLAALDERLQLPNRAPGSVPIPGRQISPFATNIAMLQDWKASDWKSQFAENPGHNIRLPSGKDLAAVLRKIFEKQRKKVLAKLGSGTVAFAELPDQFIALRDWDDELSEEVMPVVELYFEKGGRRLLNRIGASPDAFSVTSPNIRRAVQDATLKFSKSTNDTTSLQLNEALSKLRQELSAGLIEGDPLPLLRDRVNEVFDQATQSRAQVIAASEASRALHGGQELAAKETGIVLKKRWLASGDACELCLPLADKVVGMEDNFAVDGGGPYAAVPYPPRH